MTRKFFLPYARQSINNHDIEAVAKALQGEWITRGPLVEEFERQMANYCGAAYAVAFSSGSAALAASFFAAGVGAGDRIISTPNTFVTSVGPAVSKGAIPVFVDISRSTGAIEPGPLALNANQFKSRGKSIVVPVHFAGIAFDMEAFDRQVTNSDLIVIEDASHAIGSSYPRGGPKVGSCAWSQMTVFSLHATKTITTGEGGVVTTNDAEMCRRLKLFRNNGIERDPAYLQNPATPWHYEVQALTNNFNFTEGQAALGLSQMRRVDLFAAKRRELMKGYRHHLRGLEQVSLLTDAADAHTAFHLCVVQIDFEACKKEREAVMLALKDVNIGTQVHYIPLYRHPCFQSGGVDEYFPEMEKYYSQALTLPLFYDMTMDDVAYVANKIKKIID